MTTEKRKEPRMFTGVLLLTIAGMAEKILGVLLKIPLSGYLGEEGMGYFNSAYNIFSTFYTVSITGLPIATSIMISRSRMKGRKLEISHIFRVSLFLFVLIGIIGSSIMFFGGGAIANLIDKNNNSPYCIQAISPILLFICISSSIRGFYQGHQNMMPSAVSELLDAIGKTALGICFGGYAITHGYSVEVASAAAIAGITIAHLFGMGYLIITKCISKPDYSYLDIDIDNRNTDSYITIFKKMMGIAIPITLSSLALGLTSTIDTFTINNILNNDRAMAIYGTYTTLAVTLYRLPQAFITPIASSLTPTLTAAIAAKNEQKTRITLYSSLKITAVISIPCAVGMGVLARPILSFLFGGSYSLETIKSNAPLLSILSIAIFLMAMLTITSSILQSYGKQSRPVISMSVGTVIKLIFNIALIHHFGIYGAPIATVASFFVMAFINFIFVFKYADIKASIFKSFLSPALIMIVCVPITLASFFLCSKIFPITRIATIVSILITVIFYIVALFVTKTIGKEEILMLPKGKKIYGKLLKMKLVK
ncbi:MAG: polysaccharide biosynthesis protein [Clostridia bacterium]|nr:polysaccharide biosynthesis protein [Clostridia bacterium]